MNVAVARFVFSLFPPKCPECLSQSVLRKSNQFSSFFNWSLAFGLPSLLSSSLFIHYRPGTLDPLPTLVLPTLTWLHQQFFWCLSIEKIVNVIRKMKDCLEKEKERERERESLMMTDDCVEGKEVGESTRDRGKSSFSRSMQKTENMEWMGRETGAVCD